MKTKTKASILAIAILAVVASVISAILLRQADKMDARHIGRTGVIPAGQYTIAIFEENGRTFMIASEESYILAEVNTVTKFTVMMALIALAAAALIAFVALSYDSRPAAAGDERDMYAEWR